MALADTVEFAFRRRYGLPPTDPRYLDATVEEMLLDYWAHRFWDDPDLRNEMVNPDYEAELADLERQAADGDWDMVINDDYEGNSP